MPKYKDLFKDHMYMSNPQYFNEKVQEIRGQVGDFEYGTMAGIDNRKLEYREAMVLES